jgi:hypothetical protein
MPGTPAMPIVNRASLSAAPFNLFPAMAAAGFAIWLVHGTLLARRSLGLVQKRRRSRG